MEESWEESAKTEKQPTQKGDSAKKRQAGSQGQGKEEIGSIKEEGNPKRLEEGTQKESESVENKDRINQLEAELLDEQCIGALTQNLSTGLDHFDVFLPDPWCQNSFDRLVIFVSSLISVSLHWSVNEHPQFLVLAVQTQNKIPEGTFFSFGARLHNLLFEKEPKPAGKQLPQRQVQEVSFQKDNLRLWASCNSAALFHSETV